MKFFNQFTLETPESVELEFTLAGIGNRAYALLIDYIALGSILFALLATWALLYYLLYSALANSLGDDVLSLWLLAIQLLIIFAVFVGYFVFFETLWQGQTPGKRLVKIRVIRDDGRPIRLQQATLRALLRPIDDLFFLGMFFIAFGKREKRIGDWVAGTVVIQEERDRAPPISISEAVQALAKQLQQEAEVSRLLPEDFALVREYLRRQGDMHPKARRELSRQLTNQVKDIIKLETLPEVTANEFLEAVYLAYQNN